MAKAVTLKKGPIEQTFVWHGTDKRQKRVKGEMRGLNANLIKVELKKQGITPLRVRPKPKELLSFGDTITAKDIMLFTRQLCTMLNSGIAIVQALEMVGHGSKKPKLKGLILSIKKDVEEGSTFASALGKHRIYFNDLYCNLVRSGEEAGVLEKLLDKVAIYLEKTEAIKAKIKKAMTYPTIVLVAAFIVTAVIMIFVIPQFEDLFKSFGADLPAFTVMVLDISRFFTSYWWAIFGGIGGAIFLFLETRKRSRAFNQMLDRLMLQMPLFGQIAALGATARFARTLSTMFSSGVPLVDSLSSVAGATGNVVYENAVLDMKGSVEVGQQLNFAMRQTGLFNDMVVQMVAIGEESGALGDMLAKVADFYEAELDATIDMLTTLVEPLLMGVLAIIVGSLIIAMYLPIFKLGATVG